MKIQLLDKIKKGQVYPRKEGGKCLVNDFRFETDENKNQEVWVEFSLEVRDEEGRKAKSEKLEEFTIKTEL